MSCALCPNPALCNPVCRAFEFAPAAVRAQMREACAASGQMTAQEVSAHVEAGEMPTADEVIELAQALEQKRGLQIMADVAALGAGFHDGAFRAGWESACEEAVTRLRTEEWELCLKPVGAPKVEAGEMPASYWQRGCDDSKAGKPETWPTNGGGFDRPNVGYANGYRYGLLNAGGEAGEMEAAKGDE